MCYKLPLANAYLMAGKGFFSDAFELYTPIYGIAITGLPIAVARMVAERSARNQYNDVRSIYKVARKLFTVVGLAGFAILLLLAYPYAKYVCSGHLDSLPAILTIAPSIFFCCAMSSYRGYYEGLRNMIPTAISQVIEALCKLILGLALAMLVMRYGQNEFIAHGTVFGRMAADADQANAMLYPWSAAASIVGITVGTMLGFLYLWFQNKIKGDGITRAELINSPPARDAQSLRRELIHLAIPVVLSSAVLTITNLIDAVNVNWLIKQEVVKYPNIIQGIFGEAFRLSGTIETQYAAYIKGIYSTVLDFRNLVPTIVSSFGVSALPAISHAWALGHKKTVQTNIHSVLRTSMMISLPAGLGMAVLSKEILTLFYAAKNPGMVEHAWPILFVFGLSTFLMAVSAPITSMLQAIGRTDVPVKSLIAGAVVKVGANFLLVGNPRINIQGAAISSVLCYVVIVAVNLVYLLRVSKVKLRLVSVWWKPFLCALLSAGGAWAIKGFVARFDLAAKLLPSLNAAHGNLNILFAVGGAILVAVVIYAISMLLTKAITREDVEMLPKGKRMAAALAKYGLLGEG
jgi:stage V sporulation protein B